MTNKHIITRIKNKCRKLRLQPIRIFCLHHVSAEYDASYINKSDWMNITSFKIKVTNMQKMGVGFISLPEALRHISKDWMRHKKYAVLTFDDGYASLKEILPWLKEQNIPATLFINGKYLDGESYRLSPKERYLTKDELYNLYPLITIGSHGWEHTNAYDMTIDEFKQSIEQNIELLHTHPCYIPFHAYTWGKHSKETDAYLQAQGIIPVYIDGKKNYNNLKAIHRELL